MLHGLEFVVVSHIKEVEMVRKPEYYPWSSYHFFKHPQAVVPSYMNIDSILDYYLGTVEERKEKYCQTLQV
jgi:putative transposase